MKHQIVSVAEFKAKCIALLNQVAEEGGTVTVTKRGKPLATVARAKQKPFRSSEGILAGKEEIVGDIVDAGTADLWEVADSKISRGHPRRSALVGPTEETFFRASPCFARSRAASRDDCD